VGKVETSAVAEQNIPNCVQRTMPIVRIEASFVTD